jgi:hypothetical protein
MDKNFKNDLVRYSKGITLSPEQYKKALKKKEESQEEENP